MHITSKRTEGLGDSSYLLVIGDTGVLVDPQRDYQRFLDDLGTASLAFVLETHLHNDYVSGGRGAAKSTGADLVLPAGAGAAFTYRPGFHMEDMDGGSFVIRPLHTPGHTPEHTSYLILVDDEPQVVFTGGSLLVASAGRTDLLGEARARQLARLQYGSVMRLAELPDEVGLYPTHGEGSFCSAGGAGRFTSTIGQEKASNPVLKHPDVESFADAQLFGLQPYPRYYARMGPINLAGPTPIADEVPPTLTTEEATAAVDGENVSLIDIRPRAHFAAGHVPGSLGLELADSVGTWAGWLVDFDRPVVLIADVGQDVDEAWLQLSRIGMDRQLGVFYDVSSYRQAGRELISYESVDPIGVRTWLGADSQVLDVRAPDEFAAGSLPGAVHCYLPDLAKTDLASVLDTSRPVVVVCESGYRATAAAGLLEQKGFEPVVLSKGGVSNLISS